MLVVVVLNDWVTETKLVPACIEGFDQLGKVEQRAGQPVDLVDHDDIDPACRNIGEQALQAGRSSVPPDRPPSSYSPAAASSLRRPGSAHRQHRPRAGHAAS
jgi:hypothetical protein